MKETFYFSHDYNARSDDKIKNLIRRHGMCGYGVYWSIIEDLYNNANALRLDCDGIAYDLRVDLKTVESVISDFGLFVFNGEYFGSLSVQRRLDKRDEKSEKARLSAKMRWGEKNNDDANALQSQSDSNAIKESKVNESKLNERKEEVSPAKKPDAQPSIFLRDFQVTESTDLPEKTMISFWKLFRENMAVFDLKQPTIENAKYSVWLPPIKKLLKTYSRDDLLLVYWYLKESPILPEKFSWRKEIRSTSKLAEKFEKLLLDAKVKNYIPAPKKTELKLRGINDW